MNKLYFGDPNRKEKFHIFNEDKKSLCGKWAMPFTQFDDEDLVKGNETCGIKDCKRCFEIANKLALSELNDTIGRKHDG